MINFINCDMFTYRSDLLIIPCDTNGHIAPPILQNLESNNYPLLNTSLSFGTLKFFECPPQSLHKFIGYAAAVEEDDGWSHSEIEQITKIIKTVEAYCVRNHIKTINLPLLGTGAGGLDPNVVFSDINKSISDKNLIFNIVAFGDRTFNEIVHNQNNKPIKNPRVFISYTGEDIENRNWVRNFVIKLRENGVDARCDMFNLNPGAILPQWMTDEIISADKVILVCDEKYVKKADSYQAGVGWETMIIQGDMLVSPNKNKYVALVRESNIKDGLPIYMNSTYAIVWPKNETESFDSRFKNLLLCLFDCNRAPELGEVPDYIRKAL